MRILICGDRNWTNKSAVRLQLASLPPGKHIIIEGENGTRNKQTGIVIKGADLIAREAAIILGYDVLPFPADWNKYGTAAGPIRNQQMLDEGKPDEVWAFHPDINRSKGTADMVKRSIKASIPVKLFDGSE